MGLYNLKSGVADETDINRKIVLAAASGAISIQNSIVLITKGTAAAMTLAAPSAAQNGTVITIIATTAAAHTVTAGTIGFNAGNAGTDVGTFGGAIGDGFQCIAYGGEWYTFGVTNVTFA